MGNGDSKISDLETHRLEGNKIFKKLQQKTYSKEEKHYLAFTCVNIYLNTLKTTTKEEDIYKLNKNLGLSYSKLIEYSDYYSKLINIKTLNDFMKWFTEMAKHYSAALCYYGKKNTKNPKYQELLTSVENKCLKYFRLLSENEHLPYMEKIVYEFEKIPSLKYTLTAYMLRYYFIHALQLYEEKQHAKSKGLLYKIKEIINSSLNDKTKNQMNMEIQDIFSDTLESVNFYLNRNTIVQLLDNGISLYNLLPKVDYEQLLQNAGEPPSPDKDEEIEAINDIKLNAVSYFRDALNELTDLDNNSNGMVDIELEAICSSYLGQLLVSFKDKQIDKIKTLCATSLHLGLSLAPKDVSDCDWFKNAKTIFDRIIINENEYLERENYAEQLKKETIKLANKNIFEELDAKSPKNANDDKQIIEYCKFILKHYPFENSKPIDIEMEIKEDKKKFIRYLSSKYHPDRCLKETEEDFKNYVIFEHISKVINSIYTSLKG